MTGEVWYAGAAAERGRREQSGRGEEERSALSLLAGSPTHCGHSAHSRS
jgi:hypothetical protein